MRHFLLLLGAASLFAFPVSAQTVDLATRTFWIGERPGTMDVDSPFVALLDIDWIDDVLGDEPVFKHAALQIEQELGPDGTHSVARSVAHLLPGEVELGPDAFPPQFRIPGYKVYGDLRDKKVSPVYVPDDPSAGYKVRCGWVVGEDRFSVCSLYATYAPDDNIRLKARLYFPPDPIDQPTRFRDVVERLREVAYCLDVTEKLVDVPTVYPDLKGCKPDEVS
jgi:hypothetical protein